MLNIKKNSIICKTVTNNIMRSSTFRINQNDCSGCGTCVDAAPEQIAINDNGVAMFIKTESDTANFGTEEVERVFAAAESCPSECIEEIG